MEPHPEIIRFCTLLEELEALLQDNDANFWAIKIGRCRRSAENSDEWSVHCFLGLFGGMGSLNDLVLHQNGKPLGQENDKVHALLEKAWRVGKELVTG
ncbi:DUF6966 domain-containing protein [Rhizobium rhizogenes]|uniref:DUF6966 domain-containing protein n=1 Tax=Rhizobium rhizogenes TaxID=359 RepID=UPI00068E9B57|nr:hypothetical protein [Rhizobium rhizogenes]MQB29778.1 hypothetical protein [Rhizobium rhizogenes]NTF68257.1 hypothetical protein [Rhizobium rhizogenes]NTI80924.1 hypothetical protein [Rhizobium rhizogenes]NTJ23110.1 hypothetical protein [Rhizobium rhizogenes]QUE81796.1 hypothetical protein EML492_08380 [Rhizobium rhizogenes]